MAKKSLYKVDFSIDNLSLINQQAVFKAVISQLDYNQRQDLHITVTDYLGGKHFIWDGNGVDPDGVGCRECNKINCDECALYHRRKNLK